MTHTLDEKVYEGVLEQIKAYIEDKKLEPGDKLPSERMFSELLQVGRSSIREALRALELLGLIETRRGEGTFMRAYRPYHMVGLLSKFLLNNTRTREELLAAKQMLEKEILILSIGQLSSEQLAKLQLMLPEACNSEDHLKLFTYLFEESHHPLLLSMWQFICGFTHTVHDITYSDDWYRRMYQAMIKQSKEQMYSLF
ncbi:FadR/GntR family transcriptional regulator [Halobacillus sp. A5]|uniref:FadR/GntR family transcriptional regulator n=1 Tax=Halobacillus sp. A5 TaxID=2880263 RepID=UPI0020A63839|nr:GntR family transcriptional regulator [Halobacillus sp. A5]MCP3025453.1 GntR family transcriptional regulator [Halobacillus sp. A5]